MKVRAKKRLGQHFLNDEGIAHRIVESLLEMDPRGAECSVLEVGPGMGVLTKYLLQEDGLDFRAVEIDEESVEYLIQNYPSIRQRLYEEDFLRMDLGKIFPSRLAVIGNFPYNISSQIFKFPVQYLLADILQDSGIQGQYSLRSGNDPEGGGGPSRLPSGQ